MAEFSMNSNMGLPDLLSAAKLYARWRHACNHQAKDRRLDSMSTTYTKKLYNFLYKTTNRFAVQLVAAHALYNKFRGGNLTSSSTIASCFRRLLVDLPPVSLQSGFRRGHSAEVTVFTRGVRTFAGRWRRRLWRIGFSWPFSDLGHSWSLLPLMRRLHHVISNQ